MVSNSSVISPMSLNIKSLNFVLASWLITFFNKIQSDLKSVKFIAGGILFLFAGINNVNAAARIASVSGNWSSTATWGGQAVPTSADAVTINNGITVTVDAATANCNTLTTVDAGTLTINGTNALTVTGLITLARPSTTVFTVNINAGSITAGSLTMSATTTGRNDIINITTGTLTINGALTTGTTGCQINITGAGNLAINGTFTTNPVITPSTGSTVTYGYAGTQTVDATTYSNLTLAGTSAKTIQAGTTVNGILSMQGTATASAAPTYGATATLQYNTTTARTAGPEWLATFTAGGGVIIAGTGAITMNAAKVIDVGDPLTINLGATLNTGNLQLTLGGDFHKSGTFTAGTSAIVIANTAATQTIDGFTTTGTVSMTKTAGTATFNGNVSGGVLTINGAGGTLNLGAGFTHLFTGWTRSAGTLAGNSSTVSFSGTISGTGAAFTPGTSTVNYTGAAQTVAAVNYYNLTLSGSGAKTLGAATTSIGGNFTLSGTANATGVVGLSIGGDVTLGTGTTFTSGTFSHSVAGNWTNNGGTFTAGLGTITMTGSGKTIGGTANTTFYNLTINSSGGISLGRPTTVSRVLALTNGILTTSGTNLLYVTYNVTGAITGGGASTFINGPVRWTLPTGLVSGSTYIFPVGKGSSYYPFTMVNPTTGTGAVTAQVEAFNTTSGGTYNSTLSSISVTEYWSLATVGNFTNSSLSVSRPTGISPLNVLAGNATAANGSYASLLGTPGGFGITNSNSIGTYRYFVLAQGTPTITTSVASLSGFSYPQNTGPSTEQSFTINGNSLLTNISITPATDFEISTGTGVSFVASNPISLAISNGGVNTTTIYVRMKAGLTTGTYNTSETITASSSGATSKTITCSGTVGNSPTITLTPTSRTGFSYVYTQGPSVAQTFQVSGTTLVDTVYVTPPSDYEISPTGATYQSTVIKLNQTKSATLAATTIYARLKTGLGVGSHNQSIAVTSTGATLQNESLTGSVSAAPTLTTTTSFLGGFIYTFNAGPSAVQSFLLTGSNLSTTLLNDTVIAPANFEISKTSGSGFTTGSLIYTRGAGVTTQSQTIYVRMVAGLAVGNYGPANVSLKSSLAVVKTVALSGSVVNGATILTSKLTLTGFGYEQGTGPSSEQTFTISGGSLTANMTITPPANFEISTTTGSGFQSTAITLTQVSGKVNPTVIYVRLKAGLTSGLYNGVNIVAASTGAASKNIALVGQVFVSPLVTAGGGGSYCEGSSINLTSSGADIQNRYWQGPNSFYSTTQNPSLTTNATTSLSGTYTVTGNITVGGNLVTNGDFESGNTSFGSGYTYADTTNTQALYPEGVYTVVKLPRSVHPNFSSWPDHTTGRGMQMVVNGAPVAGVVVWSQSVPVIPGATYQFTYWEQTVNVPENPKNASQLQLYVNGISAGPVYTAPQVNNQWQQFLYNASAGGNTVLNLELINQNTVASGNDFALDDIVFQQILAATSNTSVTVNPNLPVSVVVDASANPVYQNTPVTFTATPTNGGTAPSYQWQVNGVNVGTNSSTYTYAPADGDVVNCILTSNYPCPTGNPASDNVVMSVIQRVNYWIGTIDTDWAKTGNWTANYVPQPGDDVEYATLANYGTNAINDLWVDKNRTIGSLINATVKRLVIPPAKGLEVNNYVVTDGSVDRIYIQSSSTLANGSMHFNQPSQNSNVNATVDMYSRASWNLANPVNSKYKWQYFGIPLTSVVANPTFYGSYVRRWDETGTAITNHWIQLANDSVLDPFYGYEICQAAPTTITFKGTLVTSDFNSGQMAITPTALYPGQHVFANSYTAGISIANLTFGSDTEQTAYLYNTGTYNEWLPDGGNTSGTNSGQYIAVPKNLAGKLTLPSQVASMQAVLVKATNSTSNATFGIPYNSIVVDFDSAIHRIKGAYAKELVTDMISTIVNVSSSNSADRMWLITNPSCSHKFDNGWDGTKFIGSALSPQLYSVENDAIYQVNATDDIGDMKLGFQAGEDTEYTFTFTQSNILSKYAGIYLVDLLENKTIDVTETGTTYTFNAVSSDPVEGRFRIVARHYEKNAPDSDTKIKVFSGAGAVLVQNQSSLNGEIKIFDMAGHYVRNVKLVPNTIETIPGLAAGVYVVKASISGEEVTKRLIVN